MHLLERGIAAPGSIAAAPPSKSVVCVQRTETGIGQRVIEPELLDDLPPADPRARQARRDLHRVNTLMRHHALMADLLRTGVNGHAPTKIADLGAGAGDFMLCVARRLSPRWNAITVRLIDRQNVVNGSTIAKFGEFGWHAEFRLCDALDWLREASGNPPEIVVVANLFLHELGDAQLMVMFREVAKIAKLFVAIEPRRATGPLICSHLLWLMGCNRVSRHDGVASVRAGFSGRELSALWPANDEWDLTEKSAGLFSHSFVARRCA